MGNMISRYGLSNARTLWRIGRKRTDPPGRPKCHMGAAARTTSRGSSQNIRPGMRVLAEAWGRSAVVKTIMDKAIDSMIVDNTGIV